MATLSKRIYTGLFAAFTFVSIFPQVGVNTTTPKGILHIDAGVVGNVSDDVVISKDGNVGLGTDNPIVKLDIQAVGIKPLRLVDGSEAPLKVLMSDATGRASWQYITGGWSASLSGGYLNYTTTLDTRSIIFSASSITDTGGGAVSPATGTITVPYTGTYRVVTFGVCSTNRTVNTYYVAFFYLFLNGGGLWGPHTVGHTSMGEIQVGFSNFFKLNAGDKLTLKNHQIAQQYANGVSNVSFVVDYMR